MLLPSTTNPSYGNGRYEALVSRAEPRYFDHTGISRSIPTIDIVVARATIISLVPQTRNAGTWTQIQVLLWGQRAGRGTE